jgi:hypothetical protein
MDGVVVGVSVKVGDGVNVGVKVAVAGGEVAVRVLVAVGVLVGVAVSVGVAVRVAVAGGVLVGVGVSVGTVAVGEGNTKRVGSTSVSSAPLQATKSGTIKSTTIHTRVIRCCTLNMGHLDYKNN